MTLTLIRKRWPTPPGQCALLSDRWCHTKIVVNLAGRDNADLFFSKLQLTRPIACSLSIKERFCLTQGKIIIMLHSKNLLCTPKIQLFCVIFFVALQCCNLIFLPSKYFYNIIIYKTKISLNDFLLFFCHANDMFCY